MKVSVVNRQRRVPIKLAEVKAIIDILAKAVCQNLLAQPCPFLAPVLTHTICARAEVSVIFVSDAAIRNLNKRWRNKDAATDVLSFPLALDAPPVDMPWELGEVFISLERALAQAKELNHGFEREVAFLSVHGLLHILGFDHETPEDEKEMFSRQHEILFEAGFPRA